jgi:anti-sigma regulatory factor (Ser/Thr protein kinase)
VPEPVDAELTLDGVTASVPLARRFVRSTLQSWELDDMIESAVLVVSELATNAVLHAHSAFTVTLARDAQGSVRIDVIDGSAKLPLRRTNSPGATTGRGLSIIQGLVAEWGSEPTDSGKRVWARFDDAPPGTRSEALRDRIGGQGTGRPSPRSTSPFGTQARVA